MQNHMIKAGTVVPSLKVGDVEYNTDQICRHIRENSDCGVLVFPELSITGYTCADLFGQRVLLDESIYALEKIAKVTEEVPSMTVVVGFPLAFENNLYNCGAFISNGTVAGIVPKINIPTYSEFYEERWFTSGRKVIGRVVNLFGYDIPFGIDVLAEDSKSGAVLGMDICEDLWVLDKPSTHACLAGANIIVNLSASDEVIGKMSYRKSLVEHQSAEAYCAYLYASSGMDESSTDLVFSGHQMIAENGTMLSESVFETDHVETAIIDLETIAFNRRHQNTYTTDDAEWYRRVEVSCASVLRKTEISVEEVKDLLAAADQIPARMPFVPQDDDELRERCENILRIQAQGLATRVRSTGIKNLVIGISGGLDSTLALIVCHKVQELVKDVKIIAYTMPVKGNTTSLTYNNALNLMKALNAEIHEIEIGADVKSHLLAIGHSGTYEGEFDTTYENAQARMRTYILMDCANMNNGLVVGTGDLSELALGWCTYNGDHMSMYAVNTSVPKTLVQYICRAYALTCGDENLKNILLSIIDTPISPELTPNKAGEINQKTEEKIGKYDLNDFFLFYALRYGFAPDKVLAMAMTAYPELSKEQIKDAEIRFYNRFFHQQFKRSCLPDGPKVGSITLSPRGDWRMPSDASNALWLKNLKEA